MTVDELLEMNPRLGHVARYMAEHPDIPVRFWDNGTVDLTIPPKAKLGQFLGSFRCPSCGNPVEGRSVPEVRRFLGFFLLVFYRMCHVFGWLRRVRTVIFHRILPRIVVFSP